MNRAEKRRQRRLAKKSRRLAPESRQPAGNAPDIQQALDLAMQHHTAGRLPEAETIYRRILQTDPSQPVALHLLGVISHQTGKNDSAVNLITRALAIAPDYAEAHNNLGTALAKLGRPEEAVASYLKALAIKPDYAMANNNLGTALQDLEKLDEAVASYHKALDIKPDFAEAHNNLGNALRDLGKLDEAVASYHKALDIKPDYAEAHSNLGTALRDLGKPEEAVASYHKALDIKPDFAEVHRFMARAKKHSEYDEDIRAMERAYAKSAISDEQRMHLAFGLGEAFEDLHQYEKAFGFFAEGNSIKRGSYSYSIDDQGDFVKKLEDAFDASLFATYQGSGCDDATPIFILGMLRSGTTLVEQILASHRQVHGAGELDTLGRIASSYFGKGNGVEFPESIRQVDGADFERPGVEYIQAIRKHSLDIRFITDKMPGNFKLIGLIKLMLPNAKVIHCRRDPADTCLSIFKTYFTNKHEYSHDLGELGRYYNFYRGLMEHWHSVIPGFVHDVQYEDMVADQVGQTRTLLEYCGLEWDDACLEFHKTDRPVKTASAEQVRRPIYKDSVQLWKRYETQLAPLLESLG